MIKNHRRVTDAQGSKYRLELLPTVNKLWLWGLLLAGPLAVASSPQQAAQQIKAQFVYNFANYVEWPDSAFESADSSMKICLYGNVDFARYLTAFEGVIIGRRQLAILISSNIADIKNGCHILFVGDDQKLNLPTFWQDINYVYVLSVSEREGFADRGGIINILRTQDRVQFDVNISNAINNGLFLDSDLLSLARTIKRNTGAPARVEE